MKHYKLYIAGAGILFSTFFGACKKQMNVLPSSLEVDGNVITDMKSARTVLNGVYYRFANAALDYYNAPYTAWTNVQEGMPSELSGLLTYGYGGSTLTDHTFDATSYDVEQLWIYCYNIVNAANGFLKNLAGLQHAQEQQQNEMIAEARFLRAFANGTLLLYYGQYYDENSPYGIILRKDFVSPENIGLPRSGVADTYAAILDDLDFAIANLPAQNTQKSYANSWAAKLLEARLLINRGKAEDYNEVVSITKDIIANSPFSLEAHTADIFLQKGLASNEVMMGIQPYPNSTAKFDNYMYYQYVCTDSLVSLFKDDPRKSATYSHYQDTYNTFNLLTKYYPGTVTNPIPSPQTEFCYAFRLTEAYLLEAEALTLAASGDLSTAKSLLKTVLAHAGFTDFSAVDNESSRDGLHRQIVREEVKNFVAEGGQDWLAMRRLPLPELQQLLPAIKNKDQLILPIPKSEMAGNSLLTGHQNPFYQ